MQAAPPPAIVQTIQLPINILDEGPRVELAGQLAVCANFTRPHKGSDPTPAASTEAEVCLATVRRAVEEGTISDLPAMMLALRGIPLNGPGGVDNVAPQADDVASQIAERPKEIAFDYHLRALSEASVTRKPFTREEINAVTIRDGRSALPDMRPDRNIPIDPSTSYIVTAANIVIHPDRYTTSGTTLAQTVADARTRHPAADDESLAQRCLMNDGKLTLTDCQQAAARMIGTMIVQGKARPYDPSLYGPARVATTSFESMQARFTAERAASRPAGSKIIQSRELSSRPEYVLCMGASGYTAASARKIYDLFADIAKDTTVYERLLTPEQIDAQNTASIDNVNAVRARCKMPD